MLTTPIKYLTKSFYYLLPKYLQKQLVEAYIMHKKRKINALATPTALIFFITNRCNARCVHCFYWNELNETVDELSLNEIERIAKSEAIIILTTLKKRFTQKAMTDLLRETRLRIITLETAPEIKDHIIHAKPDFRSNT